LAVISPALFLGAAFLLLAGDCSEAGGAGIGSGEAGGLTSFSLFAFAGVAFPFFALGAADPFGLVGVGDDDDEVGAVGVGWVAAFDRFAAEGGAAGASCTTTANAGAGMAAAFSAFPFVFEPLPTDSLIFASFARLKAIVG